MTFNLPPRALLVACAVPVALLAAGTLGYVIIEGWSVADGLWMTVITLTTIGFGEAHPLTQAGRFFTMLLALGGIFFLFYTATELIRSIITGEMATLFGRQRMEHGMAQIKDHVIVCGYGRMGRFVCREFAGLEMPFVVLERDHNLLAGFDVPGGFPLHGDATSDEVLKKAGVERARALVTVVASDADNLYITMSARFLNAGMLIVSRAEDEPAIAKLTRAGANRIISPYLIGGHRVAQAVLRPAVLDFIELATQRGTLELQIEETKVASGSRLAGKALSTHRLRQDLGVVVVAVRKADGRMLANPPEATVLEPGDVLVSMASREQLDQMEALARE